MHSFPAADADTGGFSAPRDGFHEAVVEQEHVMATHLAVIEGWLGMLEDDSLSAEQRCRAARVARERTEALRLDLCALINQVKLGLAHAD
ncbi:MAG: hypothetical protein ACTHWA_09310 [Arachnia sp.]